MKAGAPLSPAGFMEAMAALGHPVSRETLDKLEAYAELLGKWQNRINLVAPDTLPNLWHRHMLDSAQGLAAMPAEDIRAYLDIGSGAGFPALVLAILKPAPLILIEADQRKGVFLREAARITGIGDRVRILTRRAELVPAADMPPPATGLRLVTARAVTILTMLIGWAYPFLGPRSKGLFWKGRSWREELTVARRDWNIAVEPWSSVTDPGAAILLISEVESKV